MVNRMDLCPGCGRHCAAGAERCGYGKKYFKKKKEFREDGSSAQEKDDRRQRCKWEKYVSREGMLFHLFLSGRLCKQALRKKKLTEVQLIEVFSDEERLQLDMLLKKLLKSIERKEYNDEERR